ncbi:MAG: smc 1 [Lacunisphaera sp.]|nr:smc 1 [Lacunisphaera sp.]
MNKTLLLIMCDFMLLNLLALTRWEKAEPTHTQLETAAPRSAVNAPAVNADMVELMKVSLEDEKAAREKLAAQLSTTQGSLTEREKNLNALQQQKGQLENTLAAAQTSTRELEQRYTAASQEASMSKEQLAKLQRELEERRAEADRQKAELARMERQNTEARQRIENLNVAVRVAEQEKGMLTQNLTEAKQQVEVERLERAKVQEQTTQLGQNVGQLAAKSGELSKEIRDNRPINPNLIFSEFLANRVQTKITARRPGLFSPTVRDKDTQTVLVSDGNQVYALMHISDTPFALSEVATDYDQVSGQLVRGSFNAPISQLQFLQLDQRLIVAPVDSSLVALMGAKVYQLAKEPFKFPDAVLVRADDGRYGDTPFRIDQSNSSYVKLDNRIVTRLFGDIAPKRGDLVFSKTGELIGMMVNNDYCAVLGNFTPVHSLQTGDNPTPKTSTILAEAYTRLQRLPYKLQ